MGYKRVVPKVPNLASPLLILFTFLPSTEGFTISAAVETILKGLLLNLLSLFDSQVLGKTF